MKRPLLTLAAMLVAIAPAFTAPRFFADDPITREDDPYDASRVQSFPIHLSWDLISALFTHQGERDVRRAANVNTIGEVPDSSWFTNRIGSTRLTEADVARGPDTTNGPAAGTWTVVSGKSEGVRPGFTIVDASGIRWFLKFDARGYPEQATGAEVVATKLFWALGYNVAETHVATLWPADLTIGADATITINGRRRPLTSSDVHAVLARAERNGDGGYRVLASKALEGKPIGEFLYYGTRDDDPNDVVPHEDRRELRGMGVFAAWIDRVDAKAGNTLDTLVTDRAKTVVRHHVLDFGSTLGSAGVAPNEYWEGYQYIFEGKSLSKKLLGAGLPVEQWRTIDYPDLRGVGRFEGNHFDPARWRSRVPNAAYVRADADDTFWAARKVMAFTNGMIAAAVKAGHFSDPAAERYLTETLAARRDAIGRRYLTSINPIVEPFLDRTGALTYGNAAVDSGLVLTPTSYRTTWYRFDNATGESAPIQAGAVPAMTDGFVKVDISAVNAGYPSWTVPVRAYFHNVSGDWLLVGLER